MASNEPLLKGRQNSPDEQSSSVSICPHRYRFSSRRYITILALALMTVGWAYSHVSGFITHRDVSLHHLNEHDTNSQHTSTTLGDEFTHITASEKLQWQTCYRSRYKCASLTVPMDYNRPLTESKHHPKVNIALLMVPSLKSITSGKHSTSPLLINPGGPGGSGVMMALGFGTQLQNFLPDYDIIGFDPRGIGATTPSADCYAFPSSSDGSMLSEDFERGGFNRINFLIKGSNIGIVNTSNVALPQWDARSRMVGQLCKSRALIDGRDSILKHMSTPAVAQDMLSIVDAWDAWRVESGQDTMSNVDKRENEATKSTEGKLVFWGFSYGSLLGATFASMFPDRIGRVVLDGIVDADYYVSPIWADSLRDTDKVKASFYKYCHQGKELCAIYRKDDTEVDIKARVNKIMENLKKNPITGINQISHNPAQFTYSDMKRIVFAVLYSPQFGFPTLAELLDLIERGKQNYLLNHFVFDLEYKPFCQAEYFFPGQEANPAIMCSDKRYPLNESIPNLQARFEKMSNLSKFADVWTTAMLGCDGWGVKATDPPMRWDRRPTHKQESINTSFPLLFISNSADPVTPLYAGVKMAKKFVDAGLIEQLSEGHCSISEVSLCTIKKISNYFVHEEVPPPPKLSKNQAVEDGEWDRCKSDTWPFQKNEAVGLDFMNAEDVRMMEAWKFMGKFATTMQWFGMQYKPQWPGLAMAIEKARLN